MHILSNAPGGQRHRAAGRAPFARIVPQAGQSLAWLMALVGAGVVFAVGLLASPVASAIPGQQPPPLATAVSEEGSLVYLAADAQGRPRAIVQKPRGDLDALPARVDTASTLARMEIPEQCEVSGLYAAPRGQWVAVQIGCEDGMFVKVLHAVSGHIRSLSVDLGLDSIFLGWTPDGNSAILRLDPIGENEIVQVNLEDGSTGRLNTHSHTYNVAISPDNRRVLYTVSRGLGLGGELWMMNRDGSDKRLLLQEPRHVIAYPRWSPRGDAIAYIRMPDTNIPFTVGELWLADGSGQNRRMIAAADAGHGYPPMWSPDGELLAFIVRENPQSVRADNLAWELESNIYLADIETGEVRPLTRFEGVLTDSIAWLPNGKRLAFRTTVGGTSAIWLADVRTGEVQQVTVGAEAYCPAWLGE